MSDLNRKSMALDDEELASVAGGVGDVMLTGSGSFMSNTGTSLNIVVNWYAGVDNFGNRGLMVVVGATSGNLMASAIANSVELNVNGMMYAASNNAISLGAGDAYTVRFYFDNYDIELVGQKRPWEDGGFISVPIQIR